MREDYIDFLFYLAKQEKYPGSRDEFVEKIQTDDSYFKYALYMARNNKDQYKGTDEEFSIAIGKTKPQSTQPETVATEQTAKVEPTTTEPTKVEPAKVEPQVTETVTAKVEEPVKEPVVEEKPAIQVKEVEAPKEEVVKKEMPVGDNLMPVTEKTEVKAIETPSDKMVIKSEAKVEPKAEEVAESGKIKVKSKGKKELSATPMETIEVKGKESEMPKVDMDKLPMADLKPSKAYKPYGEKGPEVYYSEEYDQYIIKDGDNKTVAEKGSGKYEEIDKKIGETAKSVKEGEGKCDPDESGDSCSKNTLILSSFINNNYDKPESGWRASSEGKLIHKLNEDKKDFDERQESRYVRFSDMELEDKNEKDPEIQEINKRNYEYNQKTGQIWYTNDEPPKDKRFVIYKPYGDDRTLIYDKESEVILKQIDKAPEVDFSSTRTIYDENGKVVQEGSNAKEYYKNYKKNNPNEGLNVWYGYHKDRPEYKELKSLIDGLNYKKEKKNIFVAPPTETQFAPDWLKK